MASKKLERCFVDRMLTDLAWSGFDVLPGDEPPDFLLVSGSSRIALEVTRVYARENRKGSPAAAQEREFQRFTSELEAAYFSERGARTIQVGVVMPSIIRSRAVRRFSPEERRADLAKLTKKALARLRHLPVLDPHARPHRFQVRQRDGRPASFHIYGLPAGVRIKWDVANNTVGCFSSIRPEALQEKIRAKANDLPRYRSEVTAAQLLVVADGSLASGFLDLAEGSRFDPAGFDAVYFQRYPFDGTQLVGGPDGSRHHTGRPVTGS